MRNLDLLPETVREFVLLNDTFCRTMHHAGVDVLAFDEDAFVVRVIQTKNHGHVYTNKELHLLGKEIMVPVVEEGFVVRFRPAVWNGK